MTSAARSALTAAAAVALALALGISDGTFALTALALVTFAGVAVAVAACWPVNESTSAARLPALGTRTLAWPAWILGLGIAASFVYDAAYLPGAVVQPARLGAFRPVLALAALVLTTYLWPRAPALLNQYRFPALLACGVALGAIVIRASPSPGVDVFEFQQSGALALLAHKDPYALGYQNLYGPTTAFYSPMLLTPDRLWVIGNPYPPLSLVAVIPAAALGDARWSWLAAVALGALLVRRVGCGSREGELAAVLLLFQPRAFYVIEICYTEPLVLVCLLLLCLAVRRGSGFIVTGIAGALAVASKQYAPLLVLPIVLASRERARSTAFIVAGAALTYLPFLLWDPRYVVHSLLEFQILQPFRSDSLSWLAAVADLGGPELPPWPAFLLAGVILLTALRRKRAIDLEIGLLAAGAAWIAFVVFNKQAFCNYYWLAVGVLCATTALQGAKRVAPTADVATPQRIAVAST